MFKMQEVVDDLRDRLLRPLYSNLERKVIKAMGREEIKIGKPGTAQATVSGGIGDETVWGADGQVLRGTFRYGNEGYEGWGEAGRNVGED